jgi:hypothetical protein
MEATDLTAVHGLTFEVPREKVIEMLDAKIAFLQSAAAAWEQAATDEEYLDKQTADEKKKAHEKAKSEGMPPQMAPAAPQKEALQRISRKNVRTMQLGAEQWRVQRQYLSSRAVFTLTAEQLMQLSVDEADKFYPPQWKGLTA